eukprot:TRINITY_DN40180_c0_g1_i1.p1 TRINITY_DN40180_c0_g1~~TRINITY_DN40180_c0_g1_i1.p1  ORF type:complete len:302 (+),score=61.51 TRINITY_DN40180_c0_g1_i1:69-974(+)
MAEQLMAITGLSKEEAEELLRKAGGSVERATNMYLDAGDAAQEEKKPAADLESIIAEGSPSSSLESAALVCHSSMLKNGFVVAGGAERLPPDWRQGGGNFAFRYSHPKAGEALVKVIGVGGRAVFVVSSDSGTNEMEVRTAPGQLPRVAQAEDTLLAVTTCLAQRYPGVIEPPRRQPEHVPTVDPAPLVGGPRPAPRPFQPPIPDLMSGYGRGDLAPGGLGGGGMLGGPELFRVDDPLRIGMDGRPVRPGPPGARGDRFPAMDPDDLVPGGFMPGGQFRPPFGPGGGMGGGMGGGFGGHFS